MIRDQPMRPFDLVELDFDLPKPIPAANDEERRRFASIPLRRRLGFSAEEAFTASTDEFSRALVRVHCPNCRIRRAPLLSPRTRHVWSGWMWRGISHREPVTDYLCYCPSCRTDFALQVYTPQ